MSEQSDWSNLQSFSLILVDGLLQGKWLLCAVIGPRGTAMAALGATLIPTPAK